MKEKHAYKVTASAGLVCIHSEIEKSNILELLKEIQNDHTEGIFWIFKQFGEQPQEQLCIVDCSHHRIYYHYSGEVEDLKEAIDKLNH